MSIKLTVSRTSCFAAHLEGILEYYNPDFRLHLVFACIRNSQGWKGAIRTEIHTVFRTLSLCLDLLYRSNEDVNNSQCFFHCIVYKALPHSIMTLRFFFDDFRFL